MKKFAIDYSKMEPKVGNDKIQLSQPEKGVIAVQELLFISISCPCCFEKRMSQSENCPKCGKKADLVFDNRTLPMKKAEMVRVKRAENQLTMRFELNRIVQNNDFFRFEQNAFTLSTDLKTGKTIYKSGNSEEVSYGKEICSKKTENPFRRQLRGLRGGIWNVAADADWYGGFGAGKTASIFYRELMNMRSVNNTKRRQNLPIEWEELAFQSEAFEAYFKEVFPLRGIHYREPKEFVGSMDKIRSGFILIRYPILQHLPFRSYRGIPDFIQKNLKQCDRVSDVWELLTCHTSKKVRMSVEYQEGKMALLQLYGGYVQKPSNVVNFIKHARPEENSLFAYHDEDLTNFHLGMVLISSTHEKEDVWLKRIMKLRNTMKEREIIRYIADIGNMYREILTMKETFVPKHIRDIQTLHDELSREGNKLARGNEEIHYTKEELELQQKQDGYQFYLPKETYDLVEIGQKLNICVGSYGKRAARKECTIVFLKQEDEIKVCIEIRNWIIIQAKMKGNTRPTEEYKQMIIQWAKEHQLDIDTYDIGVHSFRHESRREREFRMIQHHEAPHQLFAAERLVDIH